MKGIKSMKLGLLATAAVLALVGGLMVAQVSAQEPSLTVGDGQAAPGDEATVDVTANVPGGLGAWTMDITYDPAVVNVTDCDADPSTVCNPHAPQTPAEAGDPPWDTGTVRVTGASANGLDEETVLASITFACLDEEDETVLDVTVTVFADATIGDPQDISGDTTVSNGSVTCAVPEPTVEPAAATATTGLPVVGSAPSSDGDSFGWVIAALAGAGVAALAGFGALRMRTRSS